MPQPGLCGAKSVEELQVYQKAIIAADEISAVLKRASFKSDWRLRDQLGASSESVPALIAEGFPQKTDRYFAELLHRARGESSETRTHLIAHAPAITSLERTKKI